MLTNDITTCHYNDSCVRLNEQKKKWPTEKKTANHSGKSNYSSISLSIGAISWDCSFFYLSSLFFFVMCRCRRYGCCCYWCFPLSFFINGTKDRRVFRHLLQTHLGVYLIITQGEWICRNNCSAISFQIQISSILVQQLNTIIECTINMPVFVRCFCDVLLKQRHQLEYINRKLPFR